MTDTFTRSLCRGLPFILASFFGAKSYAQTPVEVKLDVGYSYLQLGKTRFTTVTDFFVTQTEGHVTDHDGGFDGYKLSGEVGGLLPYRLGTFDTALAVKGFYGGYRGTQSSHCRYSASTDCVFVPLFDPDPTHADVSGGFFSNWTTRTSRDVSHYGGAVELRLDPSAVQAVSLKDAPQLAVSPFQLRLGFGARGLDQNLKLISTDAGVTEDPVRLNETLDTTYFGGYAGFSAWRDLMPGLKLTLATEAGVYEARGDYLGHYSATAALGGGPIAQGLSLTAEKPAFIGSLNLGLEKEMSWGRIGLFAEGEWISYVPSVRHNETDLATPASSGLKPGSTIFDLLGSQNGTTLGESSAFTYTTGARIVVPMP